MRISHYIRNTLKIIYTVLYVKCLLAGGQLSGHNLPVVGLAHSRVNPTTPPVLATNNAEVEELKFPGCSTVVHFKHFFQTFRLQLMQSSSVKYCRGYLSVFTGGGIFDLYPFVCYCCLLICRGAD